MQIIFENIKNSVVILRADLNEGVDGGDLLGTARIDASIATIQELTARKNKVIVISHHSDDQQSLSPIASYIKKSLTNIEFLQTLNIEEVKTKVKNSNSNIILLENLRIFTDESKQKLEEDNIESFAKDLSSLGEYFVYDAFSVAHRKHASVVSVSRFLPHTLGPIAQKEYDNLSKLYNSHENMLVIMGGAKLSTKLPIITHFLENGSTVFLGGAMAHPILKARGVDIKNSLTEDIDLRENIINNDRLLVPTDFLWGTEEYENKILDAGIETLNNIKNEIEKSKNIMFNGPIGMYEIAGYENGTKFLLQNLTNNNANQEKFIVTGGGDTLSAIEKLMPNFKCSYISLSGGAMLEFLANGSLIGIEANK